MLLSSIQESYVYVSWLSLSYLNCGVICANLETDIVFHLKSKCLVRYIDC